MQQQKHTLQTHLLALHRSYLQSSLSSLFPSLGIDQQVMFDVLEGALKTMQEQFVESIVEGIIQAKTKQRETKKQLEKRIQEHKTAIEHIKIEENAKYDEILKKYVDQQAIVNEIRELLQTDSIIQSIRRLFAENNKLANSIAHRDTLLKQQSLEIKELTEREIQLIRQIQTIKSQLQLQKAEVQQKDKQFQCKMEEIKNIWIQEKERQIRELRNQMNAEVALINDTKLFLQSAINQKQEQLVQSQVQVDLINKKLESLNEQVAAKQSEILRLNQQIQSINVGKGYLQQQNAYLRLQLERFDHTKKMLESNNSELFNGKENIQHKHEQLKQEYAELLESHQQLTVQHNHQLKQFQSLLEEFEIIKEELQTAKDQLLTVKEELLTYIQYHNITADELKQMEAELQESQKRHIDQISILKSEHLNYLTKLGQERMEIQFQKKELTEKISLLENKIADFQEQSKYYQIYLEEIAQLKKQLQRYNPTRNQLLYNYDQNQSSFQLINKKSKIFFLLTKCLQEIKVLKEKCQTMNDKFQNQKNLFKEYLKQAVAFLSNTLMSKSIECSYCAHRKSSQMNLSLDKMIANKDHSQQHRTATNTYGSIKKSVKNLNSKYKRIEQQTLHFTNHLQNYLKAQ